MHKSALLLLLAFTHTPLMADPLPCSVLTARVDAKLQAKGVPSYTLELVSADEIDNSIIAASGVPATQTSQAKVVGTCEGGKKRLMYTRGN